MQQNIKDFQLSQDYRDSAFQAEREVYESTIKQLKRRIGDLERTLILTNDELIKEKEILESQHKNFESNSDLKRKYIVESSLIKESRELLVMEEANNKSLAAKLAAQKEIIDNKNKHIQSITQLMEEMKKERERVLNEVLFNLFSSQYQKVPISKIWHSNSIKCQKNLIICKCLNLRQIERKRQL